MDLQDIDIEKINNIEKLPDADVEKILLGRQVLIKRLQRELSIVQNDVEEILKRRAMLLCPICDEFVHRGHYSGRHDVCYKCIDAALEQYRKAK